MSRTRRVLKWVGIVVAGLALLLVVAIIALIIWKPWAPDMTVADPAAGGQRLTEDGLIANYYPAEPGSPAIVVLGGSEGGLGAPTDGIAQLLNDEGFTTIALSYFGGEGQQNYMEELPLDYFDTAISWLGQQPEVNPDKIGIYGGSKGAEAALLMATLNPAITATVAEAPSDVVWAGVNMVAPWKMVGIGSTWSLNGEPVPYVPYGGRPESRETVDVYRAALEAADPATVEAAAIKVENAHGPMLLVCGEDDTLWPSCDMARSAEARAAAHSGPELTVLAYPDAGHFVQGPPVDKGSDVFDSLDKFGGTPDGNLAGREDSWPKIVEFFHTNLG